MVNAIPEGYQTLTPYLIVRDAAAAIEFYKQAFGAVEFFRLGGAEGKIAHAELQLGDSRIMLADEHPAINAMAPQAAGSSGVSFCLYVENVDQVAADAIAAGATVQRPLEDQMYGDRTVTLQDPFGHVWTVATHIEDVTPEEVARRMESQTGP
jgi:PhnB protein